MLRNEVPVSNQWHDIVLAGPIMHVASRRPDVVEMWVDGDVDAQWRPLRPVTRRLQVFGTGHPVPESATYIGSTLAADGALVWHLFEVTP